MFLFRFNQFTPMVIYIYDRLIVIGYQLKWLGSCSLLLALRQLTNLSGDQMFKLINSLD